MKTIKVKNCHKCPFAMFDIHWNNTTTADCLHPLEHSKPIDSYYKNYSSPKWCPLKKESLRIEMI